VHPVATDLFGGLDLARFDLIVGNPPYIDPSDAPYMSPEVCNFEPHLALFSPEAGDGILARIVRESAGVSPEVPLILEIGDDQLEALSRWVAASPLQIGRVWHDYSGKPRTVKLKRPSPAGS
jgi:release factor glutamine methyltransferase